MKIRGWARQWMSPREVESPFRWLLRIVCGRSGVNHGDQQMPWPNEDDTRRENMKSILYYGERGWATLTGD
jgi:hypothetical protein